MSMEILNYWVMPGIEHRREFDEDYAQALIVTAEHVFGIDNLRARTRKREVCEARQVACYLLRRDTDFSLERIGRLFGIDHSSVVHSILVVKNLLAIDRQFQRDWGVFIEESINN